MADDEPRAGELTTVNYGWTKPTVGASTDAWGGYINADLDGIDSVVHGVQTSIPAASSTAPVMDGTAAIGVGTTWARADHVHPSEHVNVRNFGAVGDGVADDTAAIQAAINSLPNDGGIVLFPSGKNYKITSTLSIGNGTTSAVSVKRGVILRGDGVPNTPTGSPSLNGYTATAGPKLTWAGSASNMIAINGPLQGWGVQNLFLDGASIAGVNGLVVNSASFGDCSNLTIQNCVAAGIYSTSHPLGGYTGVGNVDALRNNWTNIFVYVPAVAAAKGIFLDGDHAGTSNTDYNIFTNVFIRSAGVAANIGLYLGVCDSNVFNNLSSGAGGGVGIQFDYSFDPTFPLSNQFYNYEILGSSAFAVSGSPNSTALAAPNRFYGALQANGAAAPNVANVEIDTRGIGDNRIINGDMRIDARWNGASGTATGYTVDRWQFSATQAAKITWGRNYGSFATPAAFPYYLAAVSSSAYPVAASDYFFFAQAIEADFITDFAWGTTNAQPITLSFWAYSSLTGAFGGAIRNYAGTRNYPFSYSIPTAFTPTKITITIPGDTSPTWVLSGNGGSLLVVFSIGAGTGVSGPAGVWSATGYVSATGAVSVVATNGATFYVTGVKLEIGAVATPYNRRSLAKSMADCQRYYAQGQVIGGGTMTAAQTLYVPYGLPVAMRASPTLVITANTSANISAPAITALNNRDLYAQGGATATAATNINFGFTASAEL